MNMTSQKQQSAVELLKKLGLKEYEARTFTALTRLPEATAKEISEISAVPRTRVYDAADVLEKKGLIEIQHSNPKVFRAVSIPEATETLRKEYTERVAELQKSLEIMDPIDDDGSVKHEVWTLSGSAAIENRINQLTTEAEEELLLIFDQRVDLSGRLIDHLAEAAARGANVLIGTTDESTQRQLQEHLPRTSVFLSELKWLDESPIPKDDTTISRLLLVDKATIMVSTFEETTPENGVREQAVFGRGFNNGFVAIVRRLMAAGLGTLPANDP